MLFICMLGVLATSVAAKFTAIVMTVNVIPPSIPITVMCGAMRAIAVATAEMLFLFSTEKAL